jgi:5,10-methylenetetrahydromethanopterin reductase
MDGADAETWTDEGPCRYGVIFVGDGGPEWLDHVIAADDCGFWGLGVGDSQAIYPDVYVRLTQAAMVTRQLRLGPWVTNPVTRHPAVTAGAIASVDDVCGGRAFLGVGAGDSAAATIGERPATAAELGDYVETVDRLQRDGSAIWRGNALAHTPARRRVPIYLAASGPRTIRLAGRIADGVVIATGLTPQIVAGARRELAAGAHDVGRDPAEIDIWWLALVNIAADDDTALGELKGSLATFGNMAVKAPALRAELAPELCASMGELQRRYTAMGHAEYGASPNAELTDELGLTDYLRNRFALCGTPETFVSEVRRVQAGGARNLWFSIRVPDKERVLSMWRGAARDLLAAP